MPLFLSFVDSLRGWEEGLHHLGVRVERRKTNYAAWQMAAKAPRLEVKEAAYTHPAASEILIRNRAVAVNYVEPALQTLRPDLFPWVTYPQIFGNDIAGEVVEVGPGVEAFKPGDRVVAHAINITNNKPSEGAFQLYTIVFDYHAADVFEQLVGALAGKDCAGGLAIVPGSLRNNKVGRAVYPDFLSKALAAGSFACVPESYVVGEGLESLQKVFEVCREGGLSAKKIVVTLA